MERLHVAALVLSLLCAGVAGAEDPPTIAYTGDGSDLQEVIDAAPFGATVTFDAQHCLEISKSITIRRPLTLGGRWARMTPGRSRSKTWARSGLCPATCSPPPREYASARATPAAPNSFAE